MIFFCPVQNLPRFVKSRAQFTGFMLFFATSATLLSIVNPIVNAFALMLLAVPTYYLLFIELDRIKDQDIKAYKLGIRTVVISTCAIIVWLNDRVFCSFYTSMNITYLHAVWHVLIFLWVWHLFASYYQFFNPWPFSIHLLLYMQISIPAVRSLRILLRAQRKAKYTMSTLILASELAQLYRHTLHRNWKAQADERLSIVLNCKTQNWKLSKITKITEYECLPYEISQIFRKWRLNFRSDKQTRNKFWTFYSSSQKNYTHCRICRIHRRWRNISW